MPVWLRLIPDLRKTMHPLLCVSLPSVPSTQSTTLVTVMGRTLWAVNRLAGFEKLLSRERSGQSAVTEDLKNELTTDREYLLMDRWRIENFVAFTPIDNGALTEHSPWQRVGSGGGRTPAQRASDTYVSPAGRACTRALSVGADVARNECNRFFQWVVGPRGAISICPD